MERMKKRSGKGNSSKSNVGDITLNDFANARICGTGKVRLKKIMCDSYVKNLKDSDENILDSDIDCVEFNNKKVRNKKKNSSKVEYGGNIYPLEVWFLLSDHIRPEDVGRFAGICKDSNSIVNSPAFWFNLYKRYYQEVSCMPYRLQPEYKCLCGLKARVIRALYWMYMPLAVQLKEDISITSLYNDKLIKRTCVLMWSETEGNKYVSYFKLKQTNNKIKENKSDMLQMLDDISINSEHGCLMLKVELKRYILFPSVLGLVLIAIKCTDPRSLDLIFSSSIVPNSTTVTTVQFKNVNYVSIQNWWSPYYPHNNNIPFTDTPDQHHMFFDRHV